VLDKYVILCSSSYTSLRCRLSLRASLNRTTIKVGVDTLWVIQILKFYSLKSKFGLTQEMTVREFRKAASEELEDDSYVYLNPQKRTLLQLRWSHNIQRQIVKHGSATRCIEISKVNKCVQIHYNEEIEYDIRWCVCMWLDAF